MEALEQSCCMGCGAWGGRAESCSRCGSNRVVLAADVGLVDPRTGIRVDGSNLRFLVDVEVGDGDGVGATRLQSERLLPVAQNRELLAALDTMVRDRLSSNLEDASAWMAVRELVRNALASAVGTVLGRHLPSGPPNLDDQVEVGFRVLDLRWESGRQLPEPSEWKRVVDFEWVEVLDFNEAVRDLAGKLDDKSVDARHYDTALALREGGDRLRLGIHSKVAALLERVEICKGGSGECLERIESLVFVPKATWTDVIDLRLKASTLWGLAPETASEKADATPKHADIHLHFRGRTAAPIRVQVPCGDLGDRGRVADVFLDMGSTTTKYIVRVGGQSLTPYHRGTDKITQEWRLPPYRKADFLRDKTGAFWVRWVTALLAELRRVVAAKHNGYLRSIRLAVPQSSDLDVNGLARALRAATEGAGEMAGSADGALRELAKVADFEAVGARPGQPAVLLIPEHQAIFQHYVSPLKVLCSAAKNYSSSFASTEEKIAHQAKRRDAWDKKDRERKRYEAKGFFMRFYHDIRYGEPEVPSGGRPTVRRSIDSPADWMKRWVEDPQRLERMVLLDAGGLSLDMAVLESSKLVADCSRSDGNCGGESVTAKLADRIRHVFADSDDGLAFKAHLGNDFVQPGLDNERRYRAAGQREYQEVTHEVYEAALSKLAADLAGRWGSKGGRCTVLLTGGGSQNPHFRSLVLECFKAAKLEVDAFEARALKDLLDEARSFPRPLRELASPTVNLFEAVFKWEFGQTHGSKLAAYDKYAVAGGLMAGTEGT